LYTRRLKMSWKTSGRHCIHLLSSTAAVDIMSRKELSPVLSFTHWMPLGENIEKPEEDPRASQYCTHTPTDVHGPIYLVSPQLLVTREHIISARASSSLFSPLACFSGSGEAVPLLGLGSAGCTGVPFAVDAPVCAAAIARLSSEVLLRGVADCPARSDNRFSKVARSVLPSSSSGSTPERRISDSMRARRFSSPSIYFALFRSALPLSVPRSATYPLGGCRFFSTCVKMHSVL
jgi:hypothetical protein